MVFRLRPPDLLVSTPAAIVALVGLGALWVLAMVGETGGTSVLTHEAGYAKLVWYPTGLFLLGLLVAAGVVLRDGLRDVPRPVLVAVAMLAAFTAWSFLSILWADQQGDAWDGANRTLLYLIVFILFAGWRQRVRTAAVILGAWTLVLALLATVVLVRLPGAHDPLRNFIAFRLADPTGYPNGTACLFLMPLWPALVLAARAEVPWPLRGAFAGAAVMLANVALLTLSRGAIYSVPVVLILFLLLVPARARVFAVLAPVGAALAVTVPRVLHGADRLVTGGAPSGVLTDIRGPVVIAALAVAAIVALGAALERHAPVSPGLGRRIERSINLAAIVVTAAAVVTALVLIGNPADRARAAWHSFKQGPAIIQGKQGNRLSAGLGSHRYDVYRVALDDFLHHPVAGVGADNFGQEYLLHGRSDETPRYPHSVVFRTLAQTGVVGALLLVGWLAAALLAALRVARRGGQGAAVAAGATVTFLYWLVHGSFDWFWEIAGLGAPAVAMLGLACALAPRGHAGKPIAAGLGEPWRHRARIAIIAATVVLAVAATLSLGAPWLAERAVGQAAGGWRDDPTRAFDRLDFAATLNPLSDRPSLIAGSIALKLGELTRADRAFTEAAARNPRGDYAYLERGVTASVEGRNAEAVALLTRAAALSPRDPFTASALATARAGRQIDLERLNAGILGRARSLTR